MEKLNNIGGHSRLISYIDEKLARYASRDKSFRTLFDMMFSERDNIMAEITDGYRIKKLTYGEFRQWILETAPTVKRALGDPAYDSLVGIYMNNSMEWLVVFWTVLLCGCRPLLLNTRLEDAAINGLLQEHRVHAVISDGNTFAVPTLLASDILVRDTACEPPAVFGSEVIFMSSGTTERIKLCAYNGEALYHQICCSRYIVDTCPTIASHYQGELRHLVLLPLYHVFGFMAMYLWFGFFARTFVFLKDLNPDTILNTVRKHRVTHIFAVPLVWETIHREALRTIRSRSESTYNRFTRALSLCNRTGTLGDVLAHKLLGEVRGRLFGESVQFLISGGSHINPDTVRFFNGIGYPLVNGYGMTEIGITSVELSCKKSVRNLASIGKPFEHVRYRLDENGELLIQSRARASRIITAQGETVTAYEDWFASHDLAVESGGRYYLHGRADDLIVSRGGENLSPALLERELLAAGCREVCLFKSQLDGIVLLAYAPDCYSDTAYQTTLEALRAAVAACKLTETVNALVITPDPLLDASDFKLNRRKIAARYDSGGYTRLSADSFHNRSQESLSALEEAVRACFAQALFKETADIGLQDDFFTDLGGNSLEYFSLREALRSRFFIDIASNGHTATTVAACVQILTETGDEQ